jgi:hypothetical protein
MILPEFRELFQGQPLTALITLLKSPMESFLLFKFFYLFIVDGDLNKNISSEKIVLN